MPSEGAIGIAPGLARGDHEMTPDLTVIIPWHNEPLLERALRPFCEISHGDSIEIIIVNDASDEALRRAALHWIAALPTAKMLDLNENVGPGFARNLGLDAARGDFVTFIDADDIARPALLMDVVALARRSHAELVIGGFILSDEDRVISRTIAPEAHFDPDGNLLEQALLGYPAIWRYVFNRAFLLRSGRRFPLFRYAEDLLFLLSLLDVEPIVVNYADPVYEHFLSAEGSGLARASLGADEIAAVLDRLDEFYRLAASPAARKMSQYWSLLILVRFCRFHTLQALRMLITRPTLLRSCGLFDVPLLKAALCRWMRGV